MSLPRRGLAVAALLLMATIPAAAENPSGSGGTSRVLDLELMPTSRAQVAIWIERADGTFMQTVRLTQATAYRGIGNRPGASQMNSGFRWPYGRRENVLPVWAHRRAAAPGAEQFSRVIFQDRGSEGFASRTSADFSRDDYFCLSFDASTTRKDALDAVSCASVFNSDKGRYVSESDVAAGYAEPWEEGGEASMRALSLESLYPPRRDISRCISMGCNDHSDVGSFSSDVRRVMPEIDAVTMATPAANIVKRIQFDVPDEWPNGEYVVFVEVNVEGDYNDAFNETVYPTPMGPSGTWDYWAMNYGYPYWGQPSVVFSVPVTLGGGSAVVTSTDRPAGFGAVDGTTGEMNPMGPRITDDPGEAPGSGADRLRWLSSGNRVQVTVVSTNVCAVDDPPPECGTECSDASPCADGFLCGPDGTCLGYCDLDMPPAAIEGLTLTAYPDEKHSHQWAILGFDVPASERPLARYEVRYSIDPITEENWLTAQPAFAAEIDTVELTVPVDMGAGDHVEVELGGMQPETSYYVGIRAVDSCNDWGPIALSEIATTKINFTTVSPCFVATAAWGTPMAAEIGTLRRLRDRHLLTNAPGRAFVDVYYTVGPHFADAIRDDETLRAVARTALTPLVTFAAWLDGTR